MKRKQLCACMLSICMVISLTACGSSSGSQEETASESAQEDTDTDTDTDTDADTDSTSEDSAEEDEEEPEELDENTRVVSVDAEHMSDYVTLGDYIGLDIEETVEEVNDYDVDEQIESVLTSSAVAYTEDNAVVEDGDIVNIDYVGTLDGEEFSGGSAEDYDLTIGSGTFIEGFEEGLIGAKAGETLDLDLTFPEDYGSETLAGQDVVFTVTVNEIKYVPELTDDWVKENTDYDSVDAYRESIYEQLEENALISAQASAEESAWADVVDNSEILQYPQEDLDFVADEYEEYIEQYAASADEDVDTYLENEIGLSRDEYDEWVSEVAEESVAQDLVLQAIMDEQGMTLVDEESMEIQENLIYSYSVQDISTLIDYYGIQQVAEVIGLTRVQQFIYNEGNVETTIATADGEGAFDADAAEEETE